MKHRLPIDPDHWRYWLLGNLAFTFYVLIQSSKNIRPDIMLPPKALLFARIALVLSWVLFLLCRPYYGATGETDHDAYLAYLHEQKRAERLRKKAERKQKERERDAIRTQKRAEKNRRDKERLAAGYAPPGYKGIKCPHCGSIEFQIIGRDHKPISISGAIIGHMIAGDAGMIIGAAMGKDGKYEAVCSKCGRRFKFK